MNLLAKRRNIFSQNGEDGIIAAIFDTIGVETRWCCEFGAWDGLHFSNTRALIEQGWSAVLIEADPSRYAELARNNDGNERVWTFQRLVDAEALDVLLDEAGTPRLDLLVVDIDGLDYDVLEGSSARARVVCVEINAGHGPDAHVRVSRVAADNVGQPFGLFHELMTGRGYQLAAYYGNAFYVDLDDRLPALNPVDAYDAFLAAASPAERRWLYHVNRGDVDPFYEFGNERLTSRNLGLPSTYLSLGIRAQRLKRVLTKRHMRR